MQALLSVDQGETIYQIMRSQWLRDSDGTILWKMISKKRLDGDIEAVFYSQRASGRKYIYKHIIIEEIYFYKFVGVVREVIYEFFPDADLLVEDIPTPEISATGSVNFDRSLLDAYPNNKLGSFLVWLNYFKNGLLARFWTRVKALIKKE